MTENEAISKLQEKYEDIEFYFAEYDHYQNDFDSEFQDAIVEAIKALREIQKYRTIGTVEECRAARERQIPKKPNRFYQKYGKHKWKRKENGEIDECAWDFDSHSGVVCEICGECVCTICNPDYEKLDDCEEEYWNCPNCGKRVNWKSKYCECGQAIDWSE